MSVLHTQGNWSASKTVNDFAIYSDTNENKDIAAVYMDSRSIPKEEAEANAKLIAAAPDLLEALKFANEIIDRLSSDYAMIANKHANYTRGEARKIEEAIQKATA